MGKTFKEFYNTRISEAKAGKNKELKFPADMGDLKNILDTKDGGDGEDGYSDTAEEIMHRSENKGYFIASAKLKGKNIVLYLQSH